MLKSRELPFHSLELDEHSEGSEIQNYLYKRTGQQTVPSIWVAHQFVGGSTDLAELLERHEGTLFD